MELLTAQQHDKVHSERSESLIEVPYGILKKLEESLSCGIIQDLENYFGINNCYIHNEMITVHDQLNDAELENYRLWESCFKKMVQELLKVCHLLMRKSVFPSANIANAKSYTRNLFPEADIVNLKFLIKIGVSLVVTLIERCRKKEQRKMLNTSPCLEQYELLQSEDSGSLFFQLRFIEKSVRQHIADFSVMQMKSAALLVSFLSLDETLSSEISELLLCSLVMGKSFDKRTFKVTSKFELLFILGCIGLAVQWTGPSQNILTWGFNLIAQFGCEVYDDQTNHFSKDNSLINDSIMKHEVKLDASEQKYNTPDYRCSKMSMVQSNYNQKIYLRKQRFPYKPSGLQHSFNSKQMYKTKPQVIQENQMTPSGIILTKKYGTHLNQNIKYPIDTIKEPMSHVSVASSTLKRHHLHRLDNTKPKSGAQTKGKLPYLHQHLDKGVAPLKPLSKGFLNPQPIPQNKLPLSKTNNLVLPFNTIPQQAAQVAKTYVNTLRQFVSGSEINQVKSLLKLALNQIILQSRSKELVQDVLLKLTRQIKVGSEILKFILNSVMYGCWVGLNVSQFLSNAIEYLEGKKT